jgi:aerobic carbon-monoxide dehydrogenase large subunit
VLWAAKRVGRPVKWRGSRLDCMMSDDQGRGQIGRAEAAFDSEGRFLAVRCRFLHDVGAYIVGAGTMPMVHSAKLVESIYRVPELDVESSLVFTNAPPTTPYRGAGRPEAIFAVERCLDEAAEILGIDRLEIRRRNMLRPEELPYQNHTGFVFDTGEFVEILDRCAEEADWTGFAQRQQSSAEAGKLRGLGIAYYTHDTGNLNDRMEIRFDPAGTVTVVSGAASTGMGHETVFSQMVSDWLGVPFEAVRFLQGDTWAVPYGRGSYASRSMTVCASALRVAADKIVEKGKMIASRMLEASEGDVEFTHGVFRIAGTDRTATIQEVARASFRPGMPIDNGIGLEAVGTFAVTQPSFPNGCHICEVEIDCETGHLSMERYTVVDDFGRVINPLLAEGQVHGGIAQGIGAALLEAMCYDPATGQLISGTYMDYTLPRADDVPSIQASFHEVPCATNPAGVKGAGEGGTVGATAALFSAIRHALRQVGASDLEMPATPEKIWRAMRAA